MHNSCIQTWILTKDDFSARSGELLLIIDLSGRMSPFDLTAHSIGKIWRMQMGMISIKRALEFATLPQLF